MYKIRLNDGTEFPARWCGAAGDVLTASVMTEQSFVDIAEIFANAEKNRAIAFLYGEMETDYEGFTKLILINGSTAGEYIISLRKE